MGDEQKEWHKQYSSNLGAREFLRLGGVFLGWLMVGLVLGFEFNIGILMIFVSIGFGILWLAPDWQPAHLLVQKIMGNKNIPSKLPKTRYRVRQYIILYLVLGIQLYLLPAFFTWV
jgi:hypothetical protein